jgi:hypothetical protein
VMEEGSTNVKWAEKESGGNLWRNFNPEMIVAIDPQGSQSVVTLVTGKTVIISMDTQTLAKKMN